MAETSLSFQREVEKLILEQIVAFKQSACMSDQDILEFHLRHLQIMELCLQLPSTDGPRKGWLS